MVGRVGGGPQASLTMSPTLCCPPQSPPRTPTHLLPSSCPFPLLFPHEGLLQEETRVPSKGTVHQDPQLRFWGPRYEQEKENRLRVLTIWWPGGSFSRFLQDGFVGMVGLASRGHDLDPHTAHCFENTVPFQCVPLTRSMASDSSDRQ